MDVYTRICLYDEDSLDSEFYNRWRDKFSLRRGFGYWIWKPQVVLQTFAKMNDGDVLQYTDAGCWLNPRGVNRLMDYVAIAASHPSGILAFQLDAAYCAEEKWTKGDMLDYFGVRGSESILKSGQCAATAFFMRKCETTVQFVHDWLAVFEHDFSLCDDSPSKSPNSETFMENRHDQSAFSLLCKLRGAAVMPGETEGNVWYWLLHPELPIQARRDKKQLSST
ncbi:MAG: hypothetical protein LBR38_01355 [Synergistaceae bacterium]|jgi:hypothetical protein|nr:hypothetical protein [Synergistaceae bacterium]